MDNNEFQSKTGLEKIEGYVISYTSIPDDIPIPEWLENNSPDCYIKYYLGTMQDDESDEFDSWLREEYPELVGTNIFIEIDY